MTKSEKTGAIRLREALEEIKDLQDMLSKRRVEFKDLEKVNLELNTARVHTHHAMTAERERLIGQLHLIKGWMRSLGFEVPAPK